MSDVDIAYSSSDFFYKNKEICTSSNNEECQSNKNKAMQLFNITKTHIVSNERLHNMQYKYNDSILNTINLGIGILLSGAYVFYKITKLN
jgi:hypothetical protein